MQIKYKTGKIRSDNRAKIIAIAETEFAEEGMANHQIITRQSPLNFCISTIFKPSKTN